MIGTPSGLALSLQAASSNPIDPAPGSYGTGGCGGAVTNPEIGTWSFDGTSQSLSTLEGVLPVDLALSPDGTTFAVVVPGEWLLPGSPQLVVTPAAVFPSDAGSSPADDAGPPEDGGGFAGPTPPPPPPFGCGGPTGTINGQATAVAYDPTGRILVQTREPAQLIIDASGPSPTVVSLSSVSRDDTGHENLPQRPRRRDRLRVVPHRRGRRRAYLDLLRRRREANPLSPRDRRGDGAVPLGRLAAQSADALQRVARANERRGPPDGPGGCLHLLARRAPGPGSGRRKPCGSRTRRGALPGIRRLRDVPLRGEVHEQRERWSSARASRVRASRSRRS